MTASTRIVVGIDVDAPWGDAALQDLIWKGSPLYEFVETWMREHGLRASHLSIALEELEIEAEAQ